MKCINCKNMKMVSIEDGCGTAAKCFKASTKGKVITWAMTTLLEKGTDRVINILNSKRKYPHWCPLWYKIMNGNKENILRNEVNSMKKVWIRLGGYVEVDEQLLEKDPSQAVLKGLQSSGFKINGDSYIPEGNNVPESIVGQELDLSLNLIAK